MIVLEHDPLIRQKCYDATAEGAKSIIPKFVAAWKKYPYAVGVAAPQVGEGMKVFWFDAKRKIKKYGNPQLVINPILHHASGVEEIVEEHEGCLSCPGKRVLVPRVNDITVSWTTEQGDYVTKYLKDFEARVWLHEYDHINGKLIVDYDNMST